MLGLSKLLQQQLLPIICMKVREILLKLGLTLIVALNSLLGLTKLL